MASHKERPGSLHEPYLVDVKFREGTRVRVLDNRPVDVDGAALQSGDAIALLDRLSGSRWRRLHSSSEDALEKLRISGKHPNGKPLPDLNLWFRVDLEKTLDRDEIRDALNALDDVESVERVSKVNPELAITAPDFSIPDRDDPARKFQNYMYDAPAGINMMNIWPQWGIDGSGVRICDIEYAFDAQHKDLGEVTVVGTLPPPPPNNSDLHGTAVIGVYGGVHNGHGVRGIAYGATKLFTAAHTIVNGNSETNLPDAITRACQALSRGDIILLEIGEWGPLSDPNGPDPSFGTLPATWNHATYDAVVTAVANGIVVIEPAGNGTQNLDDPMYRVPEHRPFLSSGDPMARDDSGSIMVGGCEGNGNIGAWANTNHGLRVNLFSWAFAVATALGSKRPVPGGIQVIWDPFDKPADPDFQNPHAGFAGNFQGTSSASAIVAGAAALVQAFHKRYLGRTLASDEMRFLLWWNGTPATPGKLIGRQPNIRKTIEAIVTLYQDQIPAPVITPAADTALENVSGTAPIEVRIDFAPGDTGGGEIHYGFTPEIGSGSEPFDVADPNARVQIYDTSTLYAAVFRRTGAEGYWTRGQVATGMYIVGRTTGTGCRTAAAVLFAIAASGAAAAVWAIAWIL